MEIVVKAPGKPSRVGVLSAAFNPPTRAHLALAQAALKEVDEVVFVLPRAFPHKDYEGAAFLERLTMLSTAIAGAGPYSIGVSEGGLFIDIARECRPLYGPDVRVSFLCGRDAAERIVNWDYGAAGEFRAMLDEFDLLVAARAGAYDPPDALRERIRELPLAGNWDQVSATEVRARIARGARWEDLVPESIVPLVRQYYRAL